MASDFGVFFRQFRENFETTGSIAPSSRHLGDALSKFIGRHDQPIRILEVGPGTGAVTERILRRMRSNDQLDVVELNDKFVDVLRTKFATDTVYRQHAERSRVIHDRVEAMVSNEPYDVVVSGLPLNNFEPELIKSILETYQRLLKPGGTLSFFEYMFFRGLRSITPGRMRDVSAVMKPWLKEHEFECDWVWLNFPSAWAHHVRFTK